MSGPGREEREVRLTKQRRVLNRLVMPGDTVPFGYVDDDTDRTVFVHFMGRQDWRDMGEPEVITVTIEPRDLLNG